MASFLCKQNIHRKTYTLNLKAYQHEACSTTLWVVSAWVNGTAMGMGTAISKCEEKGEKIGGRDWAPAAHVHTSDMLP
jgi:hypothetical protein